ncbi:MAG: SDR family NAD(P)-dependent oxidoreductase, partial [Thermoprotei archaeon]
MKKFKFKKAIVTGGAGFIGSYLVEELLQQCKNVTVLDNFSSGRIENLENVKENKKLKIVKVDLRNKNSIDEYFKECDV